MDKLITHIVSKYLFIVESIKPSKIHFLYNNKSFVIDYSNYCGYYYGCFLSCIENDYIICGNSYTFFNDSNDDNIRYIIDENFNDFTYFDISLNSILNYNEKVIFNNDMLIVNKLLQLNNTNPTIEFLKTEKYNSNIKHELEKRGLKYDEINDLLINNECIITGSLLIQILKNEIYEESDIDILCFDSSPIIKYFTNNIIEEEYDEYLGFQSFKLNFKNNIINIICVEYSDLFTIKPINLLQSYLNLIKNKFDFTFCMNVYDGYNIYYNESTLYKTSECYNNTSNINKYLIIRLNRCKKYINRGFILKGINDEDIDYLLK